MLRQLSFLILVLSLSSCCKGPYPIAVVDVDYSNVISSPAKLYSIRTDRNNLSVIIDTVYLSQLSINNEYSRRMQFEEDEYNHILYVENTAYIDTISDINYKRTKGCKPKIKNFEYKFNGELRTDKTVTID